MSYLTVPTIRLACALLVACTFFSPTQAQQKQEPTPAGQEDDVLRISTELVQTDVTVFDKQGHFVDNLQPDQFELRVDGKPVQISFFDKVVAGAANEEAQLAAARSGAARPPGASDASKPVPLDRGRIIFFFLDDLHMAADSVVRVRKTLLNFIDKEMGQNDQVAIASASGQLGFLQQLTNNKAVLRAAVARFNYRSSELRDIERPAMTLFQALEINEHNNIGLFDFFVEQIQRELPRPTPREVIEQMVRSRADSLLQNAGAVATRTLASLESLARSSAPLPGRKLIFFLSDGFILSNRYSDAQDRLRRITDAAARTGVVIYSLDARGLVTGMPDASVAMPSDPSGRVASADTGELAASHEPLRTLAADTGGRALLNSNSLSGGITNALRETSVYYLLAWRPEGEMKGGGKFRRIEVTVKGRPELTLHVRRGFFDVGSSASATRKSDENAAAKTPEAEMLKTITSLYPQTNLPTKLTLYYRDVEKVGPLVTAMIMVEGDSLSPDGVNGKQEPTTIDVMGALYNDQGKPLSNFTDHVTLKETTASPQPTASTPPAAPASVSASSARPRSPAFYTRRISVTPGLYQVRIATRDNKSGRMGRSMQWIEIPDLTKGQLALSSLLVGETPKNAETANSNPNKLADSRLSVDRRFAQTSKLWFLIYIYNAARGANGATPPDVALQVQILRDGQPVITTVMRKVEQRGGAPTTPLSFAGEIPLSALPRGQYLLRVMVVDRVANTSASQETNFEIE